MVGMRFLNVGIPFGATINSAFIDFTVDETGTTATSLTIRGEDADNPAIFVTTAFNISNRTATTAGSAEEFGQKVLTSFDDYGSGRVSDGTISGHEGVFHRAPDFSGNTTANVAGSTADRDGSQAQSGTHSQRIDINYDEGQGGNFSIPGYDPVSA